MNKQLLPFLLTALMSMVGAKAYAQDSQTKRTINVETAGTLCNLITEDEKFLIEELTLTGEINGDDFALLRVMAGQKSSYKSDGSSTTTNGKLSYINLSEVKIVAGGCYLFSWDDDYPPGWFLYLENDNEMPSAFSRCTGLTSVILPTSLKSIGNSAFSGCSGLTSITIPDGVTSIGSYAFSGCNVPTTITIPNNVTSIDSHTFSGCSGLTSITIPDGVTTIGEYAFQGCSSLTSISIPDGVTSIGDGAFQGCSSLTSITIPDNVMSINKNTFSGCSGLTSITIPDGVKDIGYSAFYNCSGLTSINIPNSVTTLEHDIFKGCSSLTSITIPSSVTSIGNGAFSDTGWYNIQSDGILYLDNCLLGYKGENKPSGTLVIREGTRLLADDSFFGCSDITSITIPVGVADIGNAAFYSCSGLTSITIPDGVANIGYGAFSGCCGLTSITIPNTVTNIEGSAFAGCSGLTSITIPDGMTSIKQSLFKNCSGLTSITIPDGVTSIEVLAFSGCSSLASITIPNSMKSIGSSAFDGCNALTSVHISDIDAWCKITFGVYSVGNPLYYAHHLFINETEIKNLYIPNTVTNIEDCIFYGCSGLTSVNIPNSVTSISSSAFYGCSGLTSLIVDIQEPLAISSSTFRNRSNVTLYVPKGSKSAYDAANYWKDFKEIKEFVKDNEVTCVIDDENAVTATAANDPTEKDVVIPESVMIDGEAHPVTAIGDGAFKDNTSMALVCIPETIEEIGEGAFAGCSGLTAIYSYNENPVSLGSANATVRSRADGNEVAASTVFAEVDKDVCILYVPKNCSDKYRNAEGWKEFKNIVEIVSSEPGDANNDTKVDSKDIDATVDYIMEGKTKDFIFKNADVKTDSKINAADIVEIINIKK